MAYTDFLDLAQARYSVRKFLDKKVPKDIIEKILKAGMLAPTGCNNQPQRIIVVESAAGLAKIKECTRCHFDAPLVFIISYNKEECWTRPYDGTQRRYRCQHRYNSHDARGRKSWNRFLLGYALPS